MNFVNEVFFWAGVMKWALIATNMGEFRKPLNQVMTKQQLGNKDTRFFHII
jgi:hypothetical protein